MKAKCRNCGVEWESVEEFEYSDIGEEICPNCETAHIEHERGL